MKIRRLMNTWYRAVVHGALGVKMAATVWGYVYTVRRALRILGSKVTEVIVRPGMRVTGANRSESRTQDPQPHATMRRLGRVGIAVVPF